MNAVFQGGGVKGIGLVGAVQAAEEKGVKFNRVAGTSSGSIVAAFIQAGYNSEQLKEIIMSMPFDQFIEKTWLHQIPWVGPSLRFILKKGLYPGDELEKWIRNILAEKNIYTFSDLEPGSLQIIASDITAGKLLVLPQDLAKYDLDPSEMEVARAIRMSTSIPYFFDPVLLKHSGTKNYIVDGGILSNFPLWVFDQETNRTEKSFPTLGFQLVGEGGVKPNQIKGPLSMLQALFSTMMSAHDNRYIEEHNLFRTIKVPTAGVGTTQFEISEEEALGLYEAGYVAGKQYFEAWSYSTYMVHYQQWVDKFLV